MCEVEGEDEDGVPTLFAPTLLLEEERRQLYSLADASGV